MKEKGILLVSDRFLRSHNITAEELAEKWDSYESDPKEFESYLASLP